MVSKANGCWPVIVVAGVLAFGSTSVLAAENTTARTATESASSKSSHHVRHHAHHGAGSRTEKHATKTATPDQKKADAADSGGKVQDDAGLPTRVADARAEVRVADASPQASDALFAGAQSAPAPNAPAAQSAEDGAPVVASDELNDVDRAAAPDKPTGKILRPAPPTPHLANATSEDTWSQTSLIGKVFIVLGGCLTIVSAARMFIA